MTPQRSRRPLAAKGRASGQSRDVCAPACRWATHAAERGPVTPPVAFCTPHATKCRLKCRPRDKARTSASTCPSRTSASGNNSTGVTVKDAPSRTSGLLDDAFRGYVRTVSRGGPRARGERAGLRARLAAAVLPAARAAVWASRTYRAGRRPGRAGGERRGPFGKSNASWVWGVG